MADQTLQSFLVKLGFTVDPAGQKRFQDTMTGAARQVNELRLGLLALAVGVEETVRRTTNAFDQLYYSSRELGLSALEIDKYRAGITGAGLDASQAVPQLARVAGALRNQTAQMRSLAAAGSFEFTVDPKDYIERVVKAYGEMAKAGGEAQGSMAQQFAKLFEDYTGLSGLLHTLYTEQEGYNERQIKFGEIAVKVFGGDTTEAYKKATERAKEMDTAFWALGETFRLGFARFFTDERISAAITQLTDAFREWLLSENTIKSFKELVDSFANWLKDPEAIQRFTTGLKDLGTVLLGIIDSIKWLLEHPALAGLLGGAAAGTAIGGPGIGTAVGGVIGLGLGQQLGGNPHDIAWNQTLREWERDHKGKSLRALETEFEQQWKTSHPGYQHGGIVPASLHPGEMVLPRQISEGLQQLFMRPAGGGFEDNQMADQIDRWLHGDTSFKPIVDLADQTFEHLRNLFLDFFPEQAAGGGAGGAGAGAGGPMRQLAQNVFEAISQSEGTFGPGGINYNKLYGGGTAPLTEMTLAEVMKMQAGMAHSAIGAFQITRETIADTAKALGLDPNTTKFTPEVQRQMASQLWATRGAQPWEGLRVHPEIMARIEELQKSGGLFAAGPAIGGGGTPLGGQPLVEGSEGRFSAGGVNLGRVNRALVETLAAASKYLPEGYRVEATSGERGGDPGSQHFGGQAMDVRIIGPGGALENKGAFGTDPGMYSRLAHAWYQEVTKRHPELVKSAEWGAEFETSKGSGKADWMHFDFGGRRGRQRREDWAYNDSSTTTVNINGITDPHGAGRAVADLKDRRSAMHMRNFRTNMA